MRRPELGQVTLLRGVKRLLTTSLVDQILDGHVLGESPLMPLVSNGDYSAMRYRGRLRRGERVVSFHEVPAKELHSVFVVTTKADAGRGMGTVTMVMVAGDDITEAKGHELLDDALACGRI